MIYCTTVYDSYSCFIWENIKGSELLKGCIFALKKGYIQGFVWDMIE